MFFYTSVLTFGNYIYYRGYKDGKRITQKIPYEPTFYVRSGKESKYKSLFGENLDKINFPSIKEAKEFINGYKDVSNFPIYGNKNFAYQLLNKMFPNPVEFDPNVVKIITVDIETTTEYGFPEPREAQEEILLITIQEGNSKKIRTYGSKPYLVKQDNVTYIECRDEFDLLRRFINDLKADYPDVITGWNVQLFDIAYLSSRIQRVLGNKALE